MVKGNVINHAMGDQEHCDMITYQAIYSDFKSLEFQCNSKQVFAVEV